MILLKDLLVEAKLYSYTTRELLDKVLNFEGKTLVFLDTETTGLEPNVSYDQLTQISVLAIDGSTWKKIDDLNIKVELGWRMKNILDDPNSPQSVSFEKASQRSIRRHHKPITHPRDILKMTHYYDAEPNEVRIDERAALTAVENFLNKFSNVTIVAHNATFDLKAIGARRRLNRLLPLKNYPVIDTLKLSRFFFIPVLLSLENNARAKEYLAALIARTKYRSYASSLGKLASIFKVKLEGWHKADEDVEILFAVFGQLITFLRENIDVDIRKQQELQAKRLRKMK
jgi:DNA polymerase III alpha subunit (gram-positive type)